MLWPKIKHGWLVFWSFRLKIVPWACLAGSGLKLIYHWNAQVFILAKLLLFILAKLLPDLVIFSRRDMYHQQIILNWMWIITKSLTYIRKTNHPRVEPCDPFCSVAATLDEYCSFRTTLRFCWYKKPVTTFSKIPNLPFSLSLWRRLMCKTFWYIKKCAITFVIIIKRFLNVIDNR